MRCFYFTSCGDRIVINQDALALPYRASAGETDAPREFLPFRALHALRRPQLCAVIDGMGGYTGGDVAARLVAETFSSVRCPDLVTEPFLTCLLETAQARLAKEALVHRELIKMGAVAAGAIVKRNQAVVFNCGDSRVYHWHDGELRRVSYDHSIVQGLHDSGEISEEEMRHHPLKNRVTGAIRTSSELTPLRLWSCHVQLNKGDALFLCTDGVWEALAHSELEATFRTAKPEISLHEALRGVFCDDNVTFIVLRD